MTEQQAVDLLDRVTKNLPAHGPDLVAEAVARGRRQRRRHVVTTAVAVAALGLTGTALTVALLDNGSGGSRAVDPATPSKPKTTAPAPTPDPVEKWSLAVTAEQVPGTFASILPGEITSVPNKEMMDTRPIVEFQWNGYAVRVAVTPEVNAGTLIADPMQRCLEHGNKASCQPGRAVGSLEQTSTWTIAGGVTTRSLTVYYAEGWDVGILEANAADLKGSPALTHDLPLTLDQLREVAYSDVWFE